mgnify:CR=1 FL=1
MLQDLIKAAKALLRAKVEHPFRVIKQQFGFQETEVVWFFWTGSIVNL